MFVLPAFGNRFVGNLVALLGAVAYTGYIYVAERVTRDDEADVWVIFASELLTMAAYGSIHVLVMGSGRLLLNREPSLYWSACYVGIATTVVPTAISIIFQRYVPPVTTAFLYTLEPIWSAVFAAGILGEHLSARGYLGGLAILLGAALHSLPLSCFPFVPGRKDRQ
ncbi:hypothetical protein Q644_24870 [Brucella intermedia 229E]|uniref:EamA domain-containing protein n=1 Tax=Brucella intermedia 229E TaxID=1337887 RepID=U4V7Z1_9HYPH|nr:hypothetical protein Q644_24870 [Brucella intermedia 229E]